MEDNNGECSKGRKNGFDPFSTRSNRVSPITCRCGCGGLTSISNKTDEAKGWIKGENKPFLPRHAPRPKRSPVWLMSSSEFKEVIQQSITATEALNKIGLQNKGSNFRTLWLRIRFENVSTYHFQPYKREPITTAIPLDQVLVEKSTYSRCSLKRRLIKENILSNKKCHICGLKAQWCGKPLTLILDHINGIFNDNRIENLRLVCGNCNSQLDTHAGRFKRIKKIQPPKSRPTKINWPPDEELLERLSHSNYTVLGRELGISDNAIRKRLKRIQST